MKICFLLNRFPELSQTFVLHQLVGLLELGHDVEVLAGGPAPGGPTHATFERAEQRFELARRISYAGMPLSLPARLAGGVRLIARQGPRHPAALRELLDVRRFGWFSASTTTWWMAQPLLDRPRRYDAIVAHFGPQGVIACALGEAGLLQGPLTTVYHGYDLGSAPRLLGRKMYRRLFERGASHLSVSAYGLQRLHELGLPRDKGAVHHLGVDTALLAPRSAAPRSSDELRLLSIGRLVAKKGFGDALSAVRQAHQSGVRLRYSIFGSGPLESQLKAQIRKSGLSGIAELQGAASETTIAAALRESDALLAPSVQGRDGDAEGIPMVLMEAMASELAVITTRHGGIPELVDSAQVGRVVSEHDVPALAHAIAELAKGPALRRSLGQAGRRRVQADFDLAKQTRAFAEHLESTARTGKGC